MLVQTLREMGQYWEVGDRYASLLARVLQEYQESQQNAAINGERVTPSTVKILADMRRCAFDLDFLIARQPKMHQSHQPTPARTPKAHDLEYLDVFDFFNVPRLPISMDGAPAYVAHDGAMQPGLNDGTPANEFNITNYMVDASSDWFMKNSV